MPTYQMIPVLQLVEPHTPQRTETLLERIDELRDSIRSNGLQQPIGVQREGESYRIVWGHRRSIAVTQLGWTVIPAMVYEADEPLDADALMGAENYHRTQTSDKEEALFYKRILPKYAEGTIGMARELNVPQKRIENLLLLEQGDQQVFTLLGERKINMSQAIEINKFVSQGYKAQAIERAVVEGLSGEMLKRWRKELQRLHADQNAAESQERWAMPLPAESDVPQAMCCIGNHEVPLNFQRDYIICHEHYNMFLQGLEALGRERFIQEAGLWRDYQRLLSVATGDTQHGGGSIQSTEPT